MAELSQIDITSAFTHQCRGSIASLATETLAHIFILAVLTYSERSQPSHKASSCQIRVSHVSRRWRAIALATPRLWSTVLLCGPFAPLSPATSSRINQINPPGFRRKEMPSCFRRIQAFLERSRSVPITVHLDVRSPTWSFYPSESAHPFTSAHMSAVMDLVLPHLERWEDIEVLSDTWEPLYVFLERCNRAGALLSSQFSEKGIPKAGSLRRFALSRCNAYFALEGTHFAPVAMNTSFAPFTEAPLLRDVTLAGVHVDWTRTPLRNLTEFSLKYHAQGVLPTPRELVSILRSSPNLERLCILGWGVCSIDDETSFSNLEGTVVLRNLQELNFGWVGIQHSLKLLSLFSWHMPKLRALALEDVANSLDPIFTQDSSVVLDYIFSMLSTSNKTFGAPSTSHVAIEELSLHSTHFSADSCRRLLLCLQNLKDLTLHNVGDTFLMSLFPSNGVGVCEATLCPKLSRVVIRDADGVSPSTLEYFMEARDPRQIISDTGASSAGSFNAPIIIEIEDLYDSDMDLFEVDPHDGSEDEFISRDSLFGDENIDGDDEYEGDDEDDSEESYYTAPSPSSHDDGALDPAVELYENHLEEDAIGSHGELLHESSQHIVTGNAVAEKAALHTQ